MAMVVLDPGHGKRDPGAVANNLNEADYNLAVALKCRDALRRSGVEVIMTREVDQLPLGANADIGADLTHRAQIANEAKADLYVSWHADSSSDPSAHGLAVWIHPNARGTRTEARAQQIGATICAATGQPNRGVNAGDFAVLRETTMDAALIEGDFVTNEDAAKKLADPAFQALQAEAAAHAICNILGVLFVPATVPSSSQTNSMPFASAAGQQCEAWLGEFYQIAGDDQKKAAHWLADQYRVERGAIAAAEACKDTSFSVDAVKAVILDLQAKYQADGDVDHHVAAKWGADTMRHLKGITE